MITQFAEWSASLAETSSLSAIAGSTIGIEAAEYLNRIQEFKLPTSQNAGVQPEPLLPALGGVPFGLARVVRIHLEIWRRHNIRPLFVFSGLNLVKDEFGPSEQAARRLDDAWRFYDANNAAAAVETFKSSNAVKATDLFRFLQTILREDGVQWMVAPYTASAQVSKGPKSITSSASQQSRERCLTWRTAVLPLQSGRNRHDIRIFRDLPLRYIREHHELGFPK
jgi:hypothetical protein